MKIPSLWARMPLLGKMGTIVCQFFFQMKRREVILNLFYRCIPCIKINICMWRDIVGSKLNSLTNNVFLRYYGIDSKPNERNISRIETGKMQSVLKK